MIDRHVTYTSYTSELDTLRQSVQEEATTKENYEIRILWLRLWVCTLQQLGMDLSPFLPVDNIFSKHFYWNLWNSPTGKQKIFSNQEFAEISEAIHQGYAVLEKIQQVYNNGQKPNITKPIETRLKKSGYSTEEWPLYGGNSSHTASTTNHGPEDGVISWKFPIGLAWYSRPLLLNGTVIVASPGIRTVLKCFDVTTGEERWRTMQLPDIVGDQLYWSPCHSGTPLLIDDTLYLRDMGSRGNQGITKSISLFHATTGNFLRKIEAGHVDYRCGYPPLAGDGRYVAVPYAIHDIHLTPPVAHPFNQIKIYDTLTQKYVGTVPTGHMFGEPYVEQNNIYVGDSGGYLYRICVTEESKNSITIGWKYKTDSAMNSGIALTKDYIIAGSNNGTIYCLDKNEGTLIWKVAIDRYEENSFKQFSKPFIYGSYVFIGCSNRTVIQIELNSGKVATTYKTDDWVRSKPVIINNTLFVASLQGTVSLFHVEQHASTDGQKPFHVQKVSTHSIFADIETDGARVFVSDSDLYLSVLDNTGKLLWKTSLIDSFQENDTRIFIDQIAGGAYYQSKPTVSKGQVFIGGPSRFIYALHEETGKEIWKKELGGAISAAPALANGNIYVGQQGGEDQFYCLHQDTGKTIWTQDTGWVWGSANIQGNRVFVPGIDGFISCLHAESGSILWRYRTGRSTCTEPAVDENRVFFGGWDEILHAFDSKTGAILWQYHLQASSDSGAQIAQDNKIFVPSGGNSFRCLDNRTGKLIWEFSVDGATYNASPACDNHHIYISCWDGLGMAGIPIGSWIHKLDMYTGKKIWSYPGGGLTAPVVTEHLVYFASTTSPYFSCVLKDKATNGIATNRWQVTMGNKVEESCIAIANSQAFILCSDGYLYGIH